ncbi:MAG: substrate-binding domain-containing protein [Bosea sp. (in: a-proteobacteria)]
MNDSTVYLSTEEAAAYLGIKERKLYELVAHGAVPCSKATGKWLFPRAALDRWIEAGLAQPDGYRPAPAPPIIGGSHDPLLEWAARRSDCGLALLSEGSAAGIGRLERNEIAMAAIHMHGGSLPEEADNAAAIMGAQRLKDAVVIGFARREQGLVTVPGNPLGLADLVEAAKRKARFGLRQSGAGAQMLLTALLARDGLADTDLAGVGDYATGQDLAFAIRAGEIDCGVATRAVATGNGLGFVPLAWERFDLALRRRTYFEPGPQRLFGLMREPEFHRHAEILSGYDTSLAGQVRLNR